ncbi:hypothetical protein KAX02_08675 [candidate division WOR-3 bacterium]|nr:hypothetical protein [candidate division WOR-3 bacterium]
MSTVVDALSSAGMYGKDLPSSKIKIALTDTQREIAGLSRDDVARFAEELDRKLEYMDPGLATVYAKDAPSILNLVRMVNKETTDGFRGALGEGNQLDIQLSYAPTFSDPDAAAYTTLRTNWSRDVRTTGTKAYIYGTANVTPFTGVAAAAQKLTMSEEEGMRFLGFFMPAGETPHAGAWQLWKNKVKSLQTLDWNTRSKESGVLISKCKQPFTLPKEHSFYVNVRYDDIGIDHMIPILAHVRMASNLETL